MVTEKEIEAWFNQLHATRGENTWRPYEAYPIFLDYLNVKVGRRLLDVGCGTGYLLKEADKRGLETYGVDISEEAVEISKKISSNSKILLGKGEQLKFPDNFFDYVTCIGALEHFIDIEKGVKEMVRVAKKDALLCIVVPNINYIFSKFRKSKGTSQQEINEKLLSLKQWKNILVKDGLEVLEIFQDKWPMPKKILTKNPLRFLGLLIHKFIWLILPLNYTYQFIFILKYARA